MILYNNTVLNTIHLEQWFQIKGRDPPTGHLINLIGHHMTCGEQIAFFLFFFPHFS